MISSYAIIILHKDFFVILTNLSLSSTWLSLPGYFFVPVNREKAEYTRLSATDIHKTPLLNLNQIALFFYVFRDKKSHPKVLL